MPKDTGTETEKKGKDAIELIEEGKTPALLKYVPKGESPKVFIDLVRNQVLGFDRQGNPRPNDDLMLFLYTCKRTGLDPLARQIYAIYRWDTRLGREKMTIQTGIDGFRLIAQRTGEYGGSDDAEFLPADESAPIPVKATVTVFKVNKKTGERMPTTATARWNEYCQKDKAGQPTGLWKQMPYGQLAKCAEALALRKAFPAELSGIYSEDEMAQSQNPVADLPTPTKFVKPQVEHGAPVEAVVETEPKPEPSTKEDNSTTKPSNTVEGLPTPQKPPTIEETVAKQQAAMPQKPSGMEAAKKSGNSIAEIRGKIKSMQERAKENAKGATE